MPGNNCCNKTYFNRKIIPRFGSESLKSRDSFRRLSLLQDTKWKVFLIYLIWYLFWIRFTMPDVTIKHLQLRQNYFKNSLFPAAISQLDRLDLKIRKFSQPQHFQISLNLFNHYEHKCSIIFKILYIVRKTDE